MGQQSISTIYRSISAVDHVANNDFQWSDDNWKKASLLGKVWLGIMVVATAVTINADRKDAPDVKGFTFMSFDNKKSVFTYGHEKFSPDNEAEAFQKALNAAIAEGFSADGKSISMFANHKIDRLILSR